MQNYDGNAIRQNKGNLQGMKDSITVIQSHMIINESLPLEKQHQYCPKGENSCCRFWKDKQNGTSTYDKNNRSTEVFMDELNPTFTRLQKMISFQGV